MTGNNKNIYGGGVHHIALRVTDFDRSYDFYTKLGFKDILLWGENDADGDKRGVFFDTGDGSLLEMFANKPENSGDGAFFHLAFKTDDCAKALDNVRSFAKVTAEPKSVIINSTTGDVKIKVAFFDGPDGEVLELFQYE